MLLSIKLKCNNFTKTESYKYEYVFNIHYSSLDALTLKTSTILKGEIMNNFLFINMNKYSIPNQTHLFIPINNALFSVRT